MNIRSLRLRLLAGAAIAILISLAVAWTVMPTGASPCRELARWPIAPAGTCPDI